MPALSQPRKLTLSSETVECLLSKDQINTAENLCQTNYEIKEIWKKPWHELSSAHDLQDLSFVFQSLLSPPPIGRCRMFNPLPEIAQFLPLQAVSNTVSFWIVSGICEGPGTEQAWPLLYSCQQTSCNMKFNRCSFSTRLNTSPIHPSLVCSQIVHGAEGKN